MTTLVTGADGLVGSALRAIRPTDFKFVTRADADLRDFSSVMHLFESFKPSKVIHLAAVVGGLGSNSQKSGDYFRDNILINTNVLECARRFDVEKLVALMSTCIFPDKVNYPLKVSTLHDGPPHRSNYGYAYAKRMLEVQSRAYNENWGCNFLIAIPANIYGPADNFSLLDGHVIPSLIHKAYISKQTGNPLNVWGTGSPLREFIYSEDVARVLVAMLDKYNSHDGPLIVSSGIENSIKEVAEQIAKMMGLEKGIFLDVDKPDGQHRKPSDVEPFRQFLPDFEWTTLESGLRVTIEWFRGNYINARK